jgi:hypothetical protein
MICMRSAAVFAYRKKENKTWGLRVHHFPRLPYDSFCTIVFPIDEELRIKKYKALFRSGCRAGSRLLSLIENKPLSHSAKRATQAMQRRKNLGVKGRRGKC